MKTNLEQYIRDLISGASSCRADCPVCGGSNTFSISKVDGNIVYYCFRASCNIRGKLNDVLSIDDLKSSPLLVSNNFIYKSERRSKDDCHFTIPSYFVSPLQNRASYNLLKRYGLIDFYVHHTDLIRYDPKLNRIVFILKDHKGVIRGATGRSLSFNVSPRWLVYSRIDGCPYILQRQPKKGKNVLVIVEDCISASCVYSISSSMGLLGTSIPDELISYLAPYERLYLALDDDATGKSIKLQKKLSAYKPTSIIPLRKDLKYFTIDELEALKKELV